MTSEKKPRREIGPMRKHEFERPESGPDRKCAACGLRDDNPVHQNARGEGL